MRVFFSFRRGVSGRQSGGGSDSTKRGVNNSFEGRTGFGIFRDFLRIFWDCLGLFGIFLGLFLDVLRIFWDCLGFFGIIFGFFEIFS